MKKLKRGKVSIKMLLKTRHKQYVDVLFNKYFISRKELKRIQSKLHKTEEVKSH